MTQKRGTEEGRRRQGFASLSPERRREVAGAGGREAAMRGTAHKWDSAEARAAGRKGGQASVAAKRLRRLSGGDRQC